MRGIGVLEPPTLPTTPAVQPTGPERSATVGCDVRTEPLVRGSTMPKLKDEKTKADSVLIEVPLAEVPPQTWGITSTRISRPNNPTHFAE